MRLLTTLLMLILANALAFGQDRFANVVINMLKVTDNIYMLTGAGGNIGVLTGKDGLLMVDDQLAPLVPKIKLALQALETRAPIYLLNTHYHGDHTGGNTQFGSDSTIMAHQNVRLRLANEDQNNYPAHALPVITYEAKARLFFNAEEIELIHPPAGYTDGDTLVYFKKANVIHMGDHFFNGSFPYVDLNAGGSVDGLIDSIISILILINDTTKIIPGHGPLANQSDLMAYLNMLQETSQAVETAIHAGRTLEQITQPGLDRKWQSWGQGFINEQYWIATLYRSYR